MVYIIFILLLFSLQIVLIRYYYTNALDKVAVKRYFKVNRTHEYGELEIVYEITNLNNVPLFNLTVVDYLPDSIQCVVGTYLKSFNSFHISVMPKSKVIRTYKVLATVREYIVSTMILLRCRDIFGMMTNERMYYTFDVAYVHPEKVRLECLAYSYSVKDTENVIRWLKSDPMSFYKLRDYMPQDPFKNINWKKTAAYNKLMVNDFTVNKDKRINLFLDMSAEENIIGSYNKDLEEIIRKAAYLTEYLLKRGFEIAVYSNSTYKNARRCFKAGPVSGMNYIYKIYDGLSVLSYGNIVDINQFIKTFKTELYDYKMIALSLGRDFNRRNYRYIKKRGFDIRELA